MNERCQRIAATVAALCVLSAGASVAQSPHGLDPANLDRSVKPSTDFYSFANGGWLKTSQVPPDKSVWGNFGELTERNENRLHDILADVSRISHADPGTNIQKIGDFYASAMDSAAAERYGVKPLAPDFAMINAIAGQEDLESAIGWFHAHGIPVLYGSSSEQDPGQSTMMIAEVHQGGLGLPDRDYYLKEGERPEAIRKEYVAHMTRMFELLGDDATTAASEAAAVMRVETRLARASKSRVELRDPVANYHKMPLTDLQKLTPVYPWKKYYTLLGHEDPGPVDVNQPEFFKEINAMLKQVPLNDWKVYLRWHLIRATAPLLSSAFVNENFRFYGTTMSGAKELAPRWKRSLRATNGALGEALGYLYVRKYFSPRAKARARDMVENLKKAFEERIKTRPWMSEATRAKALAKLEAFGVKIGYPDKWRDYSGLSIDRGPYVLNDLRADSFEVARRLNRIGKPVDRTEWEMTPPTVNAYYNPTMNEIVFPAGILQPPFFDPDADDAVNYGGMGAVIGHEMTHGFDDEGSKFGPDGNLKDWWTPQDSMAFVERTGLLVKEFDGFVPIDSMHVNGKLTLGENIADLGGLTIAYDALQRANAANPAPAMIDGFTQSQRFFLAWAQIWREIMRPEQLRLLLNTNPHSPGRFRVDGPLENMSSFYEAFPCKEGDPMFRPKDLRAEIW